MIKKYKTYNFEELEQEIQEKVIKDFVKIIIATTDFKKLSKNTNLYKAYKEYEKWAKYDEFQTQWFLGECVQQYNKNKIMKMCHAYTYLKNGEIYCEEQIWKIIEQ